MKPETQRRISSSDNREFSEAETKERNAVVVAVTTTPPSKDEATPKAESLERGPEMGANMEPAEVEPNLDSGYAWVILLVLFLLSSTTSGTSRVYGLVYARQIDIHYYNHEEASWPIATASTIENLAGILTPALAQVLSWRQIQLLSTGLFIISNLGAYFSDSLLVDILCLGVIQGLALSTNTVLLLAINNDYFERFRTTAYGIAMSGATCGLFFLCPVVNYILASDANAFRPVYLFIALVLVINLILSLFIKPRAETRACRLKRGSNLAKDKRVLCQPQRKPSRFEQNFERKKSIASVNISARSLRFSTSSFQLDTGGNRNSLQLPNERPRKSTLEKGGESAKDLSVRIDTISVLAASVEEESPRKKSSIQSIKFERLEEHERSCADGQLPPAERKFNFIGDNWKLVRTPYLHCVWIMLTIYYLVSRIYIIILADFGDDHHLKPAESYSLLNYWSMGELLGRVLLASLIDLRFISVKMCIVLTCGLLAASISLMVSIESYLVYCLCSTTTAALISLEYMLINALMVEYMGKDKAIACYSMAALISSLILFGRPTLIGLFRDQLGSYDGLLILLALICLGFAIAFALLEPIFVNCWPKPREN